MPHHSAILVSLLAALALSGCPRFGNKQSVTLSGYDTSSGYYATEPASFRSTVKFANGTSRNASHSVVNIPATDGTPGGALTNPTVLVLQSISTGEGGFVSHDQSASMRTIFNQDAGTFGLSLSGYVPHFDCRVTQNLVHSGSFTKDQPTLVGGFQARGRIALEFTYEVKYSGDAQDCQELRDLLHQCINDPANCSNETNAAIAEILYDGVISAGALGAAEVSSATEVTYTTVYR